MLFSFTSLDSSLFGSCPTRLFEANLRGNRHIQVIDGGRFTPLRHQHETVPRSQILVAVGGTLGAIAFVLGILGIVYEPLLMVAAIPFVISGYIMWFHGTGRLEFRTRARASRSRAEKAFATGKSREEGSEPDSRSSRWANPDWRRRERSGRGFSEAGVGSGQARADATTGRWRTAGGDPSPREAYGILGIDPGSSQEEIRTAYRRRVKEVHPDQDGGSEESFKQVNDAYETLTDGP